jgi:hypothetical protein
VIEIRAQTESCVELLLLPMEETILNFVTILVERARPARLAETYNEQRLQNNKQKH